MRLFVFAAVLSACFLAVPVASAQSAYPASGDAVVHLESGALQGAAPAPGIYAFLGIPYAKAPTGDLRWRPPQPVSTWTDVRPALQHGNPCPQHPAGWNDKWVSHASEDCLFLNVWTSPKATSLPVMVYFHGGSNTGGSAAEELSNGFQLVPHGVVLVTVDYRLGVFGFFRSPALDAESDHHASGNYGLLDQIASLRWVQHNIEHFGGDPSNVTIFGQSAGAVDVGMLMTSPLAKGLFSRVIEESGQVLGLMPPATTEQSEKAWEPVASKLGGTAKSLRGASTAAVMEADANAPKPTPGSPWGYRGASLDGWVLPEDPAQVFAQGKEAPVPLLLGSNAQEIVPHDTSEEATHHAMELALPADRAKQLEAVYASPGADPAVGDAGARWATDRAFRCPARQVAMWHAEHGYPTYLYRFDRPRDGQKVAVHSSELNYVFGYFPAHDENSGDDTAAREVEGYWTAFAHTGSPDVGSLPAWPRFMPAMRQSLHFALGDPTPHAETDPDAKVCDLIPLAESASR